MDEIKELVTIDYSQLFISFFVMLVGFAAVIGVIEFFLKKLGVEFGWQRRNREERELLQKTVSDLQSLKTKEQFDMEKSVEHDEKIKSDLDGIVSTNKILAESIAQIIKSDKQRDNQIDALIVANREMMGDRITQKCREYINQGGIPEDELDEFVRLGDAYTGCGGNHGLQGKIAYCKNNLPLLPVKKIISEK